MQPVGMVVAGSRRANAEARSRARAGSSSTCASPRACFRQSSAIAARTSWADAFTRSANQVAGKRSTRVPISDAHVGFDHANTAILLARAGRRGRGARARDIAQLLWCWFAWPAAAEPRGLWQLHQVNRGAGMIAADVSNVLPRPPCRTVIPLAERGCI